MARNRAVTPSKTHLVLIPSYNPGSKALETVRAARAQWNPVWVIVDGSTDGSAETLCALAGTDPGLRVLRSRSSTRSPRSLRANAQSLSALPSVLPSSMTHTGSHCARAARTVSSARLPGL